MNQDCIEPGLNFVLFEGQTPERFFFFSLGGCFALYLRKVWSVKQQQQPEKSLFPLS